MDRLTETLSILREARTRSSSILVAFSGGKDSLATLDLCSRTFERVVAFFMYLVPGLRTVEASLQYARERWGVEIRQYPHWLVYKAVSNGAYCPNHFKHDALPPYKLADVYTLAMLDTGIPLLATGAKRADGLWRRRMLKTWGKRADTIYPVVGWSTFDVLAYLKSRDIPAPDPANRSVMSGLDFTTKELLHLYDTAPDDFDRLAAYFPYAPAVVWRRQWYGVDGKTDAERARAMKTKR